MKYKTAFRLGLKLLGVLFFFTGLGAIPTALIYVLPLLDSTNSAALSASSVASYIVYALSPLVTVALGLYLFFRGEWIVNKAIPSNRNYCHECGYLLKELKGSRCPECDTPFQAEGGS